MILRARQPVAAVRSHRGVFDPLSAKLRQRAPAVGITRREALALLGAAGAVSLTGCPLDTTGDSNVPPGGGCIVTPEQTEGPYFVDELLNRADIRSDPATGAVQGGLPLRLRISVAQVDGSECSPLSGAQVDVWHCNADGVYSDVAANRTTGQKFLRGIQATDADGVTEFATIYPGWYSGRTVHIHFKVRSGTQEFNSQLYFDEAVTAQVYAQDPYRARGTQNTTNAQDGIYRDETLLALTPDADGYLGTFAVGLMVN